MSIVSVASIFTRFTVASKLISTVCWTQGVYANQEKFVLTAFLPFFAVIVLIVFASIKKFLYT